LIGKKKHEGKVGKELFDPPKKGEKKTGLLWTREGIRGREHRLPGFGEKKEKGGKTPVEFMRDKKSRKSEKKKKERKKRLLVPGTGKPEKLKPRGGPGPQVRPGREGGKKGKKKKKKKKGDRLFYFEERGGKDPEGNPGL